MERRTDKESILPSDPNEVLVLELTTLMQVRQVASEFVEVMSQVKKSVGDLLRVPGIKDELVSINDSYKEYAALLKKYNTEIKQLKAKLDDFTKQLPPDSELIKTNQDLNQLREKMTVLKRAAQKLNEKTTNLDQKIQTENQEKQKAKQEENQRNYEMAKSKYHAQSETLDRDSELFQEIRQEQTEKLNTVAGSEPPAVVEKFLNAWEEESQNLLDEINADLARINQQISDLNPKSNPDSSPEEWEVLREQQDDLSQRMTEWKERETAFYNRSKSLINLLNAQKDSQPQISRANSAIEASSQYAKTLFDLSAALKSMPEQSQSYIESCEEILKASGELNQSTQDLSHGLNQVLEAFVSNDGSFQSVVNKVGSLYETVKLHTQELEITLDEVGEQEIADVRLEDVVAEKVSVQTCANQLIESERRIQAEKLAEEQRIQTERQQKVVALREGYKALSITEAKTQLRTADEYVQKLNMLANRPYNTTAQSQSYQAQRNEIFKDCEVLKHNLESLARDLDPLAEAISNGVDTPQDHEHWNKISREFSQNVTALSTKLAEIGAQDVDGTPLKDVSQESINEKVQQKISELTSEQRELAREIPLIKKTSDQLLGIASAGDLSKGQDNIDIIKMFTDIQQKLVNKLSSNSWRGAVNNFCKEWFFGWTPFADFETKQNDLRGQVSLIHQFARVLGDIDRAQGLDEQVNAVLQAQTFWQQNTAELKKAFKSGGATEANAVNNHFSNLAEPLAAQSNQQLADSRDRQQQVSRELIQLHSYESSAGRAAYTPVLTRVEKEPSLSSAAGHGYGIEPKSPANAPEASGKPHSSHP